jgi:omega-6 fatty acid desaturase (delta-12 desaturase)
MNLGTWHALKSRYAAPKIAYLTITIFIFDLFLFFTLFIVREKVSILFFWVLLIIPMIHFYLILHEASHKTLSERHRVNSLVGHICGWLILMPYLARRRSHLLHHYWTGHPVRDPANDRMIRRFSVITNDEINRLEFIWKYWLPLIVINDRIGLWRDPFQLARNQNPPAFVAKEIRIARIYGILYLLTFFALLILNQLTLFTVYYFPSFLLLLLVEELVNLPHHAETPLLKETDTALHYSQQASVTHSCSFIPVWSNFVLLYFNYHIAHHLFPWVPWYSLKKLDSELKSSASANDSMDTVKSELAWSILNRRRPLMTIMGHYFDRIKRSPPDRPTMSSVILSQSSNVRKDHNASGGLTHSDLNP